MKVVALVSGMVLALGGCAAMQQQYAETYCHYDGAYKAGMNDYNEGKQMNPQFSQPCSPQVRADAERGYREGYTAQMKAAQQTTTVVTTPAPAPGINISFGSDGKPSGSVNIPVGQGGVVQQQQTQVVATNNRAWFCEVEAFMDKFEGWGATKLEATKAAQGECKMKNHEMHCKNAKCQMNR